jgi:hypothetical protein
LEDESRDDETEDNPNDAIANVVEISIRPGTYRYFTPARQRTEANFDAERTAYRQTKRKIGRNRL